MPGFGNYVKKARKVVRKAGKKARKLYGRAEAALEKVDSARVKLAKNKTANAIILGSQRFNEENFGVGQVGNRKKRKGSGNAFGIDTSGLF